MADSTAAYFHAPSGLAPFLPPQAESGDPQALLSGTGLEFAASLHEFHGSPVFSDSFNAWAPGPQEDQNFGQTQESFAHYLAVSSSATAFGAAAPAFNPATFKINPSD